MSTRSTINFGFGKPSVPAQPEAKIYRHSDGYPGKLDGSEYGVLSDLSDFFKEVERQTGDRRFGDPSYLAAKFVVWQASQFAYDESKPLDFLSVGVVAHDPGDIEYTYWIDTGDRDEDGRPAVWYSKVVGWDNPTYDWQKVS